MGKKVLTPVVAVMLVLGLAVTTNAKNRSSQGIVESPMLEVGGKEVEGSEFKIMCDENQGTISANIFEFVPKPIDDRSMDM